MSRCNFSVLMKMVKIVIFVLTDLVLLGPRHAICHKLNMDKISEFFLKHVNYNKLCF